MHGRVESVHCYLCYGSGLVRVMNMAGIKRIKPCTRCKGVGRLRAEVGSDIWKKCKKVGAVGLWRYNDYGNRTRNN